MSRPTSRRYTSKAPSERAQLAVGKGSVAVMGLIAIGVALTMESYGGAFDVYLRVLSAFNPAMFIPVLLGLVYTRTPWWSGMAAFGTGVLAVIGANVAANLSQGLPVGSLGILLENIELTVLGVEMGRFELNMLVGTTASTVCFFASALAHRRAGAFAERIESLERDLRTPAYATGDKLDLRGLRAYRLAGGLAVLIGVLLMILPLFGSGGALMNIPAGLLAVALGAGVIVWAQRYERRGDGG